MRLSKLGSSDVCAAISSVGCPLTIEQIAAAQQESEEISSTIRHIESNHPVTADIFKKVRDQLVVEGGIFWRCVKLPLDGIVVVPVIPERMQSGVVAAIHTSTGHANWEVMNEMARKHYYFPNMASLCREFAKTCQACVSACTKKGPHVPATRPDIPGKPWSELVIDTLELGGDRSGRYHCVLVVVDPFSKWAEVVPLIRHDARRQVSRTRRHPHQITNPLSRDSPNYLKRSFSYSTIDFWNCLPASVFPAEHPTAKHMNTFKGRANRHITDQPWSWDVV